MPGHRSHVIVRAGQRPTDTPGADQAGDRGDHRYIQEIRRQPPAIKKPRTRGCNSMALGIAGGVSPRQNEVTILVFRKLHHYLKFIFYRGMIITIRSADALQHTVGD